MNIQDGGGDPSTQIDFVKKEKHPIVVTTVTGENLVGFVYLQDHERLVDLANDDRQFLPFETETKQLLVLAKSTISRLRAR